MTPAQTTAALQSPASWSEWVDLVDALTLAPRLPGVYVLRLPATGQVVYVGMAGERSGSTGTMQGIRGRLTVYLRGRGAVSGFGEACLDRALADQDWVCEQLDALRTAGPKRAKVWAQEAIGHFAPTPAPPIVPGRSGSTAVMTGDQGEHGRRQQSRKRPATAPVIAPTKTRRRSGVLAAGVALVVVGVLGAAYLTQAVGNTVQVVAVARDVQPGEIIERTDLTVADVNPDPALNPVSASRLSELVGQRAAVALTAGSLLTGAAVTEQVLPAAGQSLVGVALQNAQLPAEQLRAGDRIRIVDTPASQAEPPAATPQTISGVVVSTAAPDDSGQTIVNVNVTVPSDQAADLAARVATRRIALILDSRER